MTAEQSRRESEPKIFVLRLVATPDCPDAIRALRQLLKVALRRFGLRCISIVDENRNAASRAPAEFGEGAE